MISFDLKAEFSANGLIRLSEGEKSITLNESEAKELVLQIIQNRIKSGQNNHGS